jgi:hypothetical protein
MTREEYELGRQVSDAEYSWLQAKVMTGAFSRSEYDRLWAVARARGEYPPLVCKTEAQAWQREPEPEAVL